MDIYADVRFYAFTKYTRTGIYRIYIYIYSCSCIYTCMYIYIHVPQQDVLEAHVETMDLEQLRAQPGVGLFVLPRNGSADNKEAAAGRH